MVRALALEGVDERSTSALLAALRDAPATDARLLALLSDVELRSLAADAGLPLVDRDGVLGALLEPGPATVSRWQHDDAPAPPVPPPPAAPAGPAAAPLVRRQPVEYAAAPPVSPTQQVALSFDDWLQARPAPQRRTRPSKQPAALRLPGSADEAFVAIDFETADAKRDSACAVALVRVERSEIVRRAVTLIRPPRPDVPNAWVHGITWGMVASSPTFAEIWPGLEAMLEGVAYLVAHNAPFDRSVMRACCEAAGLPMPEQPFECTLQMARRLWGGTGVTLPALCERFGIPLKHHDAASDAEACARLVLAARAEGLPGRGASR
jgi:DNA polymerase III subunit epsilon